MNLQTVEIPRAGARAAAADYLRAAKRIPDPARRREFEQIAAAYRAAAADEVPLIALTPTIAAGGTVVRTRVRSVWDSESGRRVEKRLNYLLPRLAVIRAAAAYAYTLGVQQDGSIEFIDRMRSSSSLVKGRTSLDAGFELPPGFEQGESLLGSWTPNAWRAMVPIVPPQHRPRGSSTLMAYQLLWEVDNWEWHEIPRPPGDPALLKHVGGDIYAVLATWDLTELEKLVLSGRRP